MPVQSPKRQPMHDRRTVLLLCTYSTIGLSKRGASFVGLTQYCRVSLPRLQAVDRKRSVSIPIYNPCVAPGRLGHQARASEEPKKMTLVSQGVSKLLDGKHPQPCQSTAFVATYSIPAAVFTVTSESSIARDQLSRFPPKTVVLCCLLFY